jgi:flagellar operon protein (TIGR03826 family)
MGAMIMADLINCPNCGRLFVSGVRNVCDFCYREVERQFETVYTYIRKKENREATLFEVSVATGVDKDQITKFIHEGRLRVANLPNLGYPCKSCGQTIQKGKICTDCQIKLREGVKKYDRQREKQTKRVVTYYSSGESQRKKR